jgi:hypothetical protein
VTFLNTTKTGKKAKAMTNLGIAVSFVGSSRGAYKIVMQHTDGSEVTLTTLVAITKAGMNYIHGHGWSRMFEISGLKEIVEMMGNGNDRSDVAVASEREPLLEDVSGANDHQRGGSLLSKGGGRSGVDTAWGQAFREAAASNYRSVETGQPAQGFRQSVESSFGLVDPRRRMDGRREYRRSEDLLGTEHWGNVESSHTGGGGMKEPNMKQVWAGFAMMALLLDKTYDGTFEDIARDAWRMADCLESEEQERDE